MDILTNMTLQYHLVSLLITLGGTSEQLLELKLVKGETAYNYDK